MTTTIALSNPSLIEIAVMIAARLSAEERKLVERYQQRVAARKSRPSTLASRLSGVRLLHIPGW